MTMPSYVDGRFDLYTITQSTDVSSIESLTNENMSIWFKELSISDKLRSQLKATGIDPQIKIRIPQYKKITSMSVVKIGDKYYKVYNIYHGTDNDGFAISDITLVNYRYFGG